MFVLGYPTDRFIYQNVLFLVQYRKMTHKHLVLQQNKQKKYSLNLPQELLECLGWKKGDNIQLDLEPNLWKEGIDNSRIRITNSKLNPYKETPIGFTADNAVGWFEYVKTLNRFGEVTKNKLIELQQKKIQDKLRKQLREQKGDLSKKGVAIVKSEIDNKLKISQKVYIPKEQLLEGLRKRRVALKQLLRETSKNIRNIKRRK